MANIYYDNQCKEPVIEIGCFGPYWTNKEHGIGANASNSLYNRWYSFLESFDGVEVRYLKIIRDIDLIN